MNTTDTDNGIDLPDPRLDELEPLPGTPSPSPGLPATARFVATVADCPVATAETLAGLLDAIGGESTDLAIWQGKRLLAVLAAGRVCWLREVRT